MVSFLAPLLTVFGVMAAVALLVVGVLAWFLKHPVDDAGPN